MTALAAYMKKHGMTDEAMARLVDRARPTITRIRLGQTKPSLGLAVKIEALTRGEVPPSSYAVDA